MTDDHRRAEISSRVRQWCDRAQIEGKYVPLSDASAVAIAAGLLDGPVREILSNRRRAGRTVPTIGGFGTLRILAEERRRLASTATQSNRAAVRTLTKFRIGEIDKKMRLLRSTFVMSGDHYANGLRAIRRERRDGVQLDVAARDALFDALMRTPVPSGEFRGLVERRGRGMLDAAAERISVVSENTRIEFAGAKASGLIGRLADESGQRFVDRYDTLLFLAGTFVDRIGRSPAWQSEHFAVQRNQLDILDELTQISLDTSALQGIRTELDAVAKTRFDESTRSQVENRRVTLDAVWSQLVDRVAALARIVDLVTRAEEHLQAMASITLAHSLDDRIDDLVARSGNRELSAANTHNVGDQFGGLDELLGMYRVTLGGDIAALTGTPQL